MPYCKLSFSFLSRNGILIAKKLFHLNKLNRKQNKKNGIFIHIFAVPKLRSSVEFFFYHYSISKHVSLYSFDRNYHKMISLRMISIYCFNRIDVFFLPSNPFQIQWTNGLNSNKNEEKTKFV